jgi:hypothetical protein
MELTDLDLQEIARLIQRGNTGGILDSEDEGGYRISWELKTEKFKN